MSSLVQGKILLARMGRKGDEMMKARKCFRLSLTFLLSVGLSFQLSSRLNGQVTSNSSQGGLGVEKAAVKGPNKSTEKLTDGQKKQASPKHLQSQAFHKFRELQSTMRSLKAELKEREPDKVKRIQVGLRFMAETKMEERMKEISDLLEGKSWDEAIRGMDTIRKDLDQLMQLLLDRDVDLRKLMEQIDKLEKFKTKVDKLLKEQQKEKEESSKAEKLQKHIQDLKEARSKVQNLIAKEEQIKSGTKALGSGSKEDPKLTEKQGSLAEETEKFEERLKALEQDGRELSKESKKPGKSSEGEGQAGEASSSAGKAAESMQRAQARMGAKAPEAALDDQESAVDELKRTEKALKKMEEEAQRKLLSLPFEQFSKKQLETMKKTDDLAKDMDKAEEAAKGEDENGEGDPVPGKKNVELAVPKQKNAAGSLKERKPSKARRDQKDAEDELKEAKKKLEDALAQLRQELQEEVLRALEERFTAMLAKQVALTSRTKVSQKRRKRIEALAQSGIVPSSIKAACRQISKGERSLEVEASSALRLLLEEGSTAVFPEIVKELASELRTVAKLLDTYETGEVVHVRQVEVERLLKALIEALRRQIEYKEGDKGGEPGDGEQPLVPLSAELRMLRTLQEGVNRKTKVVNKMKKGKARKGLADDAAKQEGRVGGLTRKLANKLQKDEGNEDGEGK
jgi:myosin heavy subunit